MSELRAVVATRAVPTLLVTSMVGRLPTAMATLAVLLLVRGQDGSYTLAGALSALVTVGAAIGQPALARVVDRRGQAGVLLAAGLVSSVAFAVLSLSGAHAIAVSAVAALVAGLATPPLEPCLRAQWPRLMDAGPRLRAAFSLDVGLQEIVFVTGPLLTVVAVGAFGDRGGVVACVVFGLLGTIGFAATRTVRGTRPDHDHPDHGRGSPWQHAALARAFAVALAAALPVGVLAIVAAAFAETHGDPDVTGWALAANAGGALVAGLYGAVRPLDGAQRPGLLTLAGLGLAVGYLPLTLPWPTVVWLLLCGVAGMALPVVLGLVFQQVQQHCPPRLLTEANAWVVTAFGVGLAGAAALAGVVVDGLGDVGGLRAAVLGSTAAAALICLAVRLSGRRNDRRLR